MSTHGIEHLMQIRYPRFVQTSVVLTKNSAINRSKLLMTLCSTMDSASAAMWLGCQEFPRLILSPIFRAETAQQFEKKKKTVKILDQGFFKKFENNQESWLSRRVLTLLFRKFECGGWYNIVNGWHTAVSINDMKPILKFSTLVYRKMLQLYGIIGLSKVRTPIWYSVPQFKLALTMQLAKLLEKIVRVLVDTSTILISLVIETDKQAWSISVSVDKSEKTEMITMINTHTQENPSNRTYTTFQYLLDNE